MWTIQEPKDPSTAKHPHVHQPPDIHLTLGPNRSTTHTHSQHYQTDAKGRGRVHLLGAPEGVLPQVLGEREGVEVEEAAVGLQLRQQGPCGGGDTAGNGA